MITLSICNKGPFPSIQVHLRLDSAGGNHDGLMEKEGSFVFWGGGVCCVGRVVGLNKRFNSSVSGSGVPISDEAIVLIGSGLTRVSGELSSGGTCGGTGMG